ncbi:MAG: hypothetical protein KatS3mg005_3272 [Bryobacteraceae bacterium]|nr:MAG: hypothetical protein KatS3mg005_3272 [Bryobacteraceae bacterium]
MVHREHEPALLPAPFDLSRIRWLPLLRVPAILVLVPLPLMFGLVPHNRWYGSRTPRSLSSPAGWYRLNRIAGIAVIAAELVPPVIKITILAFIPGQPRHRLIDLVDAVVLLLALAITAAFSGRRAARGNRGNPPVFRLVSTLPCATINYLGFPS